MTIAANAVVKAGGQGLNLHHMIEGLGGLFDVNVFCRGGKTWAPVTEVSESQASRTISRIPVIRRLRDWQVFLGEIDFDRKVAQEMPKCEYFQGATGQCRDSLSAASRKGALAMLDVVTVHIDDFSGESRRECARFGIRAVQHPWLVERIREEYERADVIRVMSEPARETFLRRGFSPEKVFVAAPPFDVSEFPVADFSQDRFVVSFVGLLEPAKGFHYLIDAFRKLDRHDSELLLWGNTGARSISQYMRDHISECDRIRIVPESVSKIGYGKVYGRSSVLVHPSLADGFGYVVGEAMASGIPVITTPTTGASQWVIDGVNGYVVPPRDSEAIRDRLQYLADHPARMREMGEAARRTMMRLSIHQFRQSYEDAIAGVRTHV